MIVNPITLSPTNRIYEALDLMKKYRISGVPITEDGSKEGRLVGILTNRDLRFETNVDRPISDVMTRENLITVPVGTTLDEAREILHQHKIEKLLVVDSQFRLKGLITVKDIQKVIKYPNASQGRARAAARRRGGRRRQGRDGAGRGAGRRARRRARHRHGARPLPEGARRREGAAAPLPGRRPRRRQRGDGGGDRGPDRAGRRRGEGRHRRRIDLHDARHRRHRRADDHGGARLRARGGAARRPDHRRRRHPLLGRHHQGDRRRRQRGDDRQPVRRHRREPGRGGPLPGPQLQGVPRHGVDRRDAPRQPRPLLPGRVRSRRDGPERRARSWCPRGSRGASPTRAAWPR